MKKALISISLLAFTLIAGPVQAQSLKVSALEDFTTEAPAQTLKVMTLEETHLKNGIIIPEGTVIKGEIFDVRPPMRGKLNATFKFKPLTYSYNGQQAQINSEEIIAKYAPYKELNKAELATSAVSTAGSMFLKVPGFGQAVSFVKGAAKDPDNNRLKSGVTQIYKDSPLAYLEEGKEVVLKKDEMFILKFKTKEEKEAEPKTDTNKANEPAAEKTIVPTASTKQQVSDPSQAIQPIHTSDPYEVLKEVDKK